MAELSELTIRTLNQELKSVSKSLETVVETINEAMVDLLKMSKRKDAQDALERRRQKKVSADKLKEDKTDITVTRERVKTARDHIAHTKEELRVATKGLHTQKQWFNWYQNSLQDMKNMTDTDRRAHQEFIREKLSETKAHKNTLKWNERSADSMRQWTDTLMMKGLSLFTAMNAWRLFLEGSKKLINELNLSINTGIPLMSGFFSYIDAAKLALSPEELIKMKKEYVLAAAAYPGKMKGFAKAVDDTGNKLIDLGITADKKLASMIASSLINTAATMGASNKQIEGVTDQLTTHMQRLQKYVAMTGEEFADMAKSISEDNEYRSVALRLNKNEQAQFFVSEVALREHLMTQKHLTRVQADAAAAELKRQQSEKYKDRLKASLRMQMLAGMMGMDAGATEQAAQIRRKGAGASKTEKTQLIDFQNSLSRSLEGMRGMGPQGELMIDSLDNSTEGMITQLQAVNTALSDGLGSEGPINTKLGAIEAALKSMLTFWQPFVQQILAGLDSGLGTLLKTLLIGIAAFMGRGLLKGVLSKTLGRGMGRESGAESAAQTMNDAFGSGRFRPSDVEEVQMGLPRETVTSGRTTATTKGFKELATSMKGSLKDGFTTLNKGSEGWKGMSKGGMALRGAGSLAAVATAGAVGYEVGTALYDGLGGKQFFEYLGQGKAKKIEDESKKRIAQLDKEIEANMKIAKEAEAKKGKSDTQVVKINKEVPPTPKEIAVNAAVEKRENEMKDALKQLVALQAANNDVAMAMLSTNQDALVAFKQKPPSKGPVLYGLS